jgi:hypothetical protein
MRADLKAEMATAQREGAGAGLWYGVFAGPVAWALDLQASYFMVQTACDSGRPLLLHAVSLLTFLAALAGLFLSWRAWTRLRGEAGASTGVSTSGGMPTESRRLFQAMFGMVLSTGFALVILATEIPNLILSTRGC